MRKLRHVACVLALCGLASFAYAKAVKVFAVTPYAPEKATADGMAIANYNAGLGVTEVQVAITDFTPGSQYIVVVSGIGTGAVATITNPSGNASGHTLAATDITGGGTVCMTMEVWLDANWNFEIDAGDTLRASGSSCN
ncbi:MAG: hypothetical protein AABZ12_00115 [Planctomycetota bacterium]